MQALAQLHACLQGTFVNTTSNMTKSPTTRSRSTYGTISQKKHGKLFPEHYCHLCIVCIIYSVKLKKHSPVKILT